MSIQWVNDEMAMDLLEQTWMRRAEMLAEEVTEDGGGEHLSVVLVQL